MAVLPAAMTLLEAAKLGDDNAFEILLDFGQAAGEAGRTKLQSRIITNPALAKAFFSALEQSLREYQSEFGEIPGEATE